MNHNAEDLIYMLYETFKVDNNIDLAELLKTTPQTISNWKSRNSINAIKKKCRELGIYKEIFGDETMQTNKELTYFEEYSKLENLATMGKGIDYLKDKLNILKEELKKDI